jgi:VWFA-related protein
MTSQIAAVVLLGTMLIPPPPQRPATIAIKVAEVQIAATVKDKDGRLALSLNKEDFLLEEDGKPIGIEYFAKQSDLALTLGLLVDSSMSQRQVLQEERNASLQFLRQVLRPEKDLAFVIGFDFEARLMEGLTSDPDRLDRALREIELPRNERQNRPAPGRRGAGGGVGTVLYDASYLAADEILRHEAGRKSIILLSDGVDMGSIESLDSAIEAVQRADTMAYCIRYYDRNAYGLGPFIGGFPGGRRGGARGRGAVGPAPDGKKVLTRLAGETGGSMFEVTGKLPLAEIFNRIQEELRSQYLIGYTPPKEETKPGFHRITLRTKDKKLKVLCRSGYYR